MCVCVRQREAGILFSEARALNDYVSSIPIYSGNPFPTVNPKSIQVNVGSLSSAAMEDKQNKLLSAVT